MTIQELIDSRLFRVVCQGRDTDREIEGVFCCDLLSLVMSRGRPGCAWVTVMGHINSLAVLHLTEMCLIVLAEGVGADDAMRQKAQEEGITVLASDESVYDCAKKIDGITG